MSDMMALKSAIDLLLVPSQVRLLRAQPLPDGVVILLRIAAGDDEVESTAAAALDRSRDVVRKAATFYIEQILFSPHADSYRVLGAGAHASAAELRRNVGLLLRWLHPDLDPKGDRSIFVSRVTAAWNDLKTADRRAAYDEARRLSNVRGIRAKRGGPKSPRSRNGKQMGNLERGRGEAFRRRNARGFLSRVLFALFHPTWRY